MRAFVVHDEDGNIVGLVRAHDDEAPPVTSCGAGGLRVLEFEAGAEDFFSTADEGEAVERTRALLVEVERRVVRRSSGSP